MTRLALSAAAIFAIALPISAQAQDRANELASTMTVSYADLNLNHPEDVAKLLHRLHSAAVSVCLRSTGDYDAARLASAYTPCLSGAIAEAVRSIDAPTLTAQYNGSGSAARFARR